MSRLARMFLPKRKTARNKAAQNLRPDATPDRDAAWVGQVSGGDQDAFGVIELEMLKFYGLKPEHYLVDVGCGSGRLTVPASGYLTGSYLGTDVIGERIDYTSRLVKRPNWRFEVVDGARIAAGDGEIDMICMFSVVTHLPDELVFLYFHEAKRVLKSGGTLLFSFLEFRMASHWTFFDNNVRLTKEGQPFYDYFIDRETIRIWAERIGFEVVAIRDGSESFVPLPHPVTTDSGDVIRDFASLGQSVCVLRA